MRNHFYYFTCIEDKSFQNDIVNIIDQSNDIQKKSTNVKAKMTSWEMMNEIGFKTLATYMINYAKYVMHDTYHRENDNFKILSMWGMCYESEDYAVPHDHIPTFFSCVYYINPPKNGPELFFPELNKSVQPEDGMLVIFPSWIIHEVPKKTFFGKRYAVSANLVPIL